MLFPFYLFVLFFSFLISRWGCGTLPTKCVSVNRIFNLAFPCKMVFFSLLHFFARHPEKNELEYVPSSFRSIKCSDQHQMFVLHVVCVFTYSRWSKKQNQCPKLSRWANARTHRYKQNEWMDGWVSEWMNEWMDEWGNEWVSEWEIHTHTQCTYLSIGRINRILQKG